MTEKVFLLTLLVDSSRHTRSDSLRVGGESRGPEHNQRRTHHIYYISVGQARAQPQGTLTQMPDLCQSQELLF